MRISESDLGLVPMPTDHEPEWGADGLVRRNVQKPASLAASGGVRAQGDRFMGSPLFADDLLGAHEPCRSATVSGRRPTRRVSP